MNNHQSGGMHQPPVDHIYVNGYGFVSEDPWLQENRAIWKTSSIIGFILLVLLITPSFLAYPVQILLNALYAPFLYLAGDSYLTYGLQASYLQMYELLLYLGSMLIALCLGVCLLRPKRRRTVSMFRRPSASLTASGVAIAMAVWVIFYLSGSLFSYALQEFRVLSLSPDTSLPSTPAATFILLMRILILPALLEEILFRGIILRSLRQFGDSFAIVASSVTFSVIHYTITRDIRGFALGLVLAYFVIRTGSVWTAILMRFASLLLSVAIDCLPHLFPGIVTPILQNILFLAVLAIGLLSFMQFCRNEGNPFILSSGHTATKISRKFARFFGNVIMVIALLLWGIQVIGYLQFIG
ncbi:MAG: CPBP family intramembrane glutamic endopeptidase [Candidatus Merdivicinus sp.]|jgi:membrane protease YdiL (CAAX protease family)